MMSAAWIGKAGSQSEYSLATLANDDPTRYERNRKIWLSQRDLIQLVEKSLTANVVFGIYYEISNNKGAYRDITSARMELGFEPVDDGSAL